MTIITRHRNAKVDRIAELALFQSCSRRELERVAQLTAELECDAGYMLCQEGHGAWQAFVIISGEATVEVGGAVVATVGPGELVGEMALLDRGLRAATVTATTPMRILAMSSLEFATLGDDAPAAMREVLRAMTGRLRRANGLAAERPTSP